jgi:pre-mRNA-processing factor 17
MGPINTLTFLDYGKRFVSTSDDKKIYVWEFGIPVVAKHISEPDMNSIPAATMHPSGSHWAG